VGQQGPVARAVQGRGEALAGDQALGDETVEQGGGDRAFVVGEVVGLGAQPVDEHVEIPHRAERAAEPAEFGAQPGTVGHTAGRRLEDGSDPPHGHPHLVQVLGVLTGARARLVVQHGQRLGVQCGTDVAADRVLGGRRDREWGQAEPLRRHRPASWGDGLAHC
jgi:hypothetical protein